MNWLNYPAYFLNIYFIQTVSFFMNFVLIVFVYNFFNVTTNVLKPVFLVKK